MIKDFNDSRDGTFGVQDAFSGVHIYEKNFKVGHQTLAHSKRLSQRNIIIKGEKTPNKMQTNKDVLNLISDSKNSNITYNSPGPSQFQSPMS
jgi:hypothetical protein